MGACLVVSTAPSTRRLLLEVVAMARGVYDACERFEPAVFGRRWGTSSSGYKFRLLAFDPLPVRVRAISNASNEDVRRGSSNGDPCVVLVGSSSPGGLLCRFGSNG